MFMTHHSSNLAGTPIPKKVYCLEARPYTTQEVALKWFSLEGSVTCNPKQNAVRNMRNYIKRHSDLQEALQSQGYTSYMRSLSPILVQQIIEHRSQMTVAIKGAQSEEEQNG